jgi:2-polyprenyl-3-methyl-5-hydroxy-6-metoxy-1,4-benzoquinol methylase
VRNLFRRILKTCGYEVVSRRNFDRMAKADALRRSDPFRFESGERQTAAALEGIRRDHLARYEVAVKVAREHFSNDGPRSIGDMFCGNGYGSYMLSTELGAHVLGVDASREAVEFADRHFANSQTLFACKEFPFTLPQSQFDIVVSFESIEHIDDYEGFARMLTAALKPGGLFMLSTPNEDILPLATSGNKFHKRHYRFDEVKALMGEQLGLQLLHWYGQETYILKDHAITGLLPEAEMDLKEEAPGSTLIYIFKRT